MVAIVLGVKEGADFSIRSSDYNTAVLPITSEDTLYLNMVGNRMYHKHLHRDSDNSKIVYNTDNQRMIYSADVRLIVQSTKDANASLSIEKSALGATYTESKERALAIDYHYSIDSNTLNLDGYLLHRPRSTFSRSVGRNYFILARRYCAVCQQEHLFFSSQYRQLWRHPKKW